MNANPKFRLKPKARDSYLQLVMTFPLAAIGSDEHLAAAQLVLDRLLGLPLTDEGQSMYLDALSELVAAYEEQHHAIGPASDADLLRHFLEAKQITQAELSRETGIAKSTLSEILSGRKPFSRQIIRKLAEYFEIDRSVLASNL